MSLLNQWRWLAMIATASVVSGGGGKPPLARIARRHAATTVRPGITVLLTDSLGLIQGKRVGLLTNQTGIDEHGTSDIDLLVRAGAAGAGTATSGGAAGGGGAGKGPRLVALFSPEHGIRGTEDRVNIASGRDQRTGVPIYSLYGATALAPPDSVLRTLDVLIIDLQDLGTRCWTYVATMVYAMRAAGANKVTVLVLDRPNPITGSQVQGPVLDSTIAWAGTHSAAHPAKPTALYSIPMRHGLTLGELARFYNDAMPLNADLRVVPMSGWRRDMWFDETGLPWVRPSPNMPSLTSATLYAGVVMFEGTNLSVGRGTPDAFQHIGAPWLDAARVVALLRDRGIAGAEFEVERFTPQHPTDGKYDGVSLHGVRIKITDRKVLQTSRLAAAMLWAVAKTNGDSLRFNQKGFDELWGSPAAREALVRGDDPDDVIDRELPAVAEFEARVKGYRLYR